METLREIEDLVRYDTPAAPETTVSQAMGLLHAHQSWVTEHRAELRPTPMRAQPYIGSR